MSKQWFPEITYEEIDDGISSNIPFINVPFEEEMPKFLFVFESRETGEYEFGSSGEKLPIVEMDLHQYADMNYLKNHLSKQDYNKVRAALGLEPLDEAAEKGQKITEKIRENVQEK